MRRDAKSLGTGPSFCWQLQAKTLTFVGVSCVGTAAFEQMSRRFRSPVRLRLHVDYCEMFMAKCKAVAFRIKSSSFKEHVKSKRFTPRLYIPLRDEAPAHPGAKDLSLGSAAPA